MQAFKDEYLFDFLNIQAEDEADERVFESEIVRNIKQFILSIGKEFTLMGNQ
ncbi:MAG: PDDEXK nuclease domain-containing protein [Bacteroidota bacterium]|nr:PDDEXK nuclease domain-containing protein [Bacteroidota bacterium]